tara:strand:+ start:180 stop:596 length:417 start_codon:yes stop_codon:yes gene_type:complete
LASLQKGENMDFEGIVCPACAFSLNEEMLEKRLKCPNCGTNLKQKKFLGFLEYLMMQGIVSNLDFFDEDLYNDERKMDEDRELLDETDPNEYEDKSEQFERYEDSVNTDKNVTDESEFRAWDGVEDDWQEFNKKKDEK